MKQKIVNYQKLRNLWSDFWKSKKHFFVPAHSLVSSDASLFWINSGVAGLKEYFLGIKKSPHKRIFNIQRAVRTNDISNIGKTNRHLSFFEMMGNFSLGDYYKKEAILWAWEFLTDEKWLNLNKDKIYFTVYKEDKATIDICKKYLKIPSYKLILGDKNTNFWDLGVGPCGPNLEIFYDLGLKFDPENKNISLLEKNIENERYLEIWNIVFSEFLNIGNQKYSNLPDKNIDTGAGLERILLVLEQKDNCFETSLFWDCIEFITTTLKIKYFQKKDSDLTIFEKINNQRLKIIADHSRTVLFLLSDLLEAKGEINFNNQRGYVIKKLIRNAVLQLFFLNRKSPFLYLIIPLFVEKMSKFYSHLNKWSKQIQNIVLNQEELFLSLLKNQKVQKIFNLPPETKVSGDTIFTLVTSIGLPLNFLEKICSEKRISLDKKKYFLLLKKHKEISASKKVVHFMQPWEVMLPSFSSKTNFLDDIELCESVQVMAVFVENKELNSTNNNKCWIIFDKSPFYAQRGGQIFDTGKMFYKNNISEVLEVRSNQRGQNLHLVNLKGSVKVGNFVNLKVDIARRLLIQNNHSATHLLHFALRSLVSSKIKQNGSLNNENYLRLDIFTPNSKINLDVLKKVEIKVNSLIKEDIKPKIELISIQEAKKIKALDFFNVKPNAEKKVRLVNFAFKSIELCGGLHVTKTSLIEKFLITNVKKIGLNNLRIYALTTNKNINAFLSSENQKFLEFLKKNNLKLEAINKKQIFKPLIKKIFLNSDSYLIQKQAKTELEKKLKEYLTQINNLKSVQNAKKYIIPSTDFYQIGKYKFICSDLTNNLKTKINNHLSFLRTLFDQHKNESNLLLFLCFSKNAKDYHFIFQFDKTLTKLSFSGFFKELFQENIKFGINGNKMQGVIFNLNIKTFIQKMILFFKSAKK